VTASALLRHHLAALALRFQHALRDAPPGFAEFRIGHGVRTPAALVAHVAGVLATADRLLDADAPPGRPAPPEGPWEARVAAVHDALARLDARFADPVFTPDPAVLQRVLQGPLVDAATHVGQLLLLRRLAGAPAAPAAYLRADVRAGVVGPDQPAPPEPDAPAG
jgi:hypothetical protein